MRQYNGDTPTTMNSKADSSTIICKVIYKKSKAEMNILATV